MAKVGRPTEYNEEELLLQVEEYLKQSIDTTEGNSETVKLPTIEGFAIYMDFGTTAIFRWAEQYPKFRDALDKIIRDQKDRLINKGLSGKYNSTIAKLILSANHGMREKSDVTSDDKPIASNTIIVKRMDKDGTSS